MFCKRHHAKGVDKQADGAASYQQVRAEIQPLDLLLFRGPDFISNTIRWIQRRRLGLGAGRFSHVGLVVDERVYKNPRMLPGKLYVLESTMSGNITSEGVTDINGQVVFGVQIRDLDEVIKAYDSSPTSRIAVGHLRNNPYLSCSDQMERDIFRSRCTTLINSVEGRQYDANLFSLCGALFPRLRGLRDMAETVLDTDKWLFCSELCALMYKSLDILPPSLDERNVVPVDFLPGIDEDGMPPIIQCPVQYIYWRQ